MLHIQLGRRLGLVEGVQVVQDASLDDLFAGEQPSITVEGRSAVAAKVAGDGVAAVASLADGFGGALHELEAILRNHEVGAVGAAANLAAVETVARGLRKH